MFFSQKSLLNVLPISLVTCRKRRKTGFELWLNSVESDLRTEFDGEESGFMKFATKKFRGLDQEAKQVAP